MRLRRRARRAAGHCLSKAHHSSCLSFEGWHAAHIAAAPNLPSRLAHRSQPRPAGRGRPAGNQLLAKGPARMLTPAASRGQGGWGGWGGSRDRPLQLLQRRGKCLAVCTPSFGPAARALPTV